MRVSIDPNDVSRIWPGYVSAYRPANAVVGVGQTVTVVQEEDDEPDFVGVARVIGIRGRFIGLDVDWTSFAEDHQSSQLDVAAMNFDLMRATLSAQRSQRSVLHLVVGPERRLPDLRPAARTAMATAAGLVLMFSSQGLPRPDADAPGMSFDVAVAGAI